jgi:hypothetical protein
MTHGDKSKAKTVKSGKASGQQKAGPESHQNAKGRADKGSNGKAVVQGKAVVRGKATSKGSPVQSGKAAGAQSGSAAVKGRETKDSSEKSRARTAAAPAVEGPVISNPAIAESFTRALQKYPNAFRKLTD